MTKIEGHATLRVNIKGKEITDVKLEAVEGARYFEGIMVGRSYSEVPMIASRICGVCCGSHAITALMAVEEALGVTVSEQTRKLREALLLSSVAQSHLLHLYFLTLPDYLGFADAIQMASKHREALRNALKLKKGCNDVARVVGGRDVHAIALRTGGFSSVPSKSELELLVRNLKGAKKLAAETAELFSVIKPPQFQRETEYKALRAEGEYAFLPGVIASSKEGEFIDDDFGHYLSEVIKPYSTAKVVLSFGKPYMVGALARMNLNRQWLSDDAKEALRQSPIRFPNYSPFANNFAQSVEVLHCVDRLIDLLEEIRPVKEPPQKINVRKGIGVIATEAPRGTLFHKYELSRQGTVRKADIITPTTQNLANIEADIKEFLPSILGKPKDELVLEVEKLIRAYDPCISCATHFLQLDLRKKR